MGSSWGLNHSCCDYPENRAQFPRRPAISRDPRPQGPGFPVPVLRPVIGAECACLERSEDALALSPAARFEPDLAGDHRDEADDLRVCGKPVWIKLVGRPRKVLVNAVEAEPEKVLGLFCRALPIPAGRLVATGDGRQARNSYNVPVLING
jgi:hypothetical protein